MGLYSLTQVLPHKAWAAGDHISAILKFTPLTKGVKVVKITMGLQEKVKTVWKTLPYEDIRVVCSKKQSVRHGQLVRRRSSASSPQPTQELASVAEAAAAESSTTATANAQRRTATSFFRRVGSRVQSRENLLGLFRTRTGEEASPGTNSPNSAPVTPPEATDSRRDSSPEPTDDPNLDRDNESEDTEVVMRMRIPIDVTPSHNIAPIFVSHRVKWRVL